MFRSMLASVALAVFVSTGSAVEVKGPVTKVNVEKNQITITVDGKDQTFEVAKDSKFTAMSSARRGRRLIETTLGNGLQGINVGDTVSMQVEKKDENSIVTSVKVETIRRTRR